MEHGVRSYCREGTPNSRCIPVPDTDRCSDIENPDTDYGSSTSLYIDGLLTYLYRVGKYLSIITLTER